MGCDVFPPGEAFEMHVRLGKIEAIILRQVVFRYGADERQRCAIVEFVAGELKGFKKRMTLMPDSVDCAGFASMAKR